MRDTRRYLVTGRVQGVGFRMFVADCARREGLIGHVCNLPDGRVEAVAEGDHDDLTRLEAALWRGPSRAVVDDVAIESLEPLGRADGFAIR